MLSIPACGIGRTAESVVGIVVARYIIVVVALATAISLLAQQISSIRKTTANKYNSISILNELGRVLQFFSFPSCASVYSSTISYLSRIAMLLVARGRAGE